MDGFPATEINGAVLSFRKRGLPCGLGRSLCTLQRCCSVSDVRTLCPCFPGSLDSLTSLLQRQGFLSPTVTPLTGLITSFISATLGINGWLGLVYQGLSPWKKRQTLLGALRFFPFRELTPNKLLSSIQCWFQSVDEVCLHSHYSDLPEIIDEIDTRVRRIIYSISNISEILCQLGKFEGDFCVDVEFRY